MLTYADSETPRRAAVPDVAYARGVQPLGCAPQRAPGTHFIYSTIFFLLYWYKSTNTDALEALNDSVCAPQLAPHLAATCSAT